MTLPEPPVGTVVLLEFGDSTVAPYVMERLSDGWYRPGLDQKYVWALASAQTTVRELYRPPMPEPPADHLVRDLEGGVWQRPLESDPLWRCLTFGAYSADERTWQEMQRFAPLTVLAPVQWPPA